MQPSINLHALITSVKRNCNISDAKYWGFYSLCGFLLRLRELYRSEKGMRPWERINQEEISEWISDKGNTLEGTRRERLRRHYYQEKKSMALLKSKE